MYRIIVVTILHTSSDEIIRKNAKITTTVTAALINLVLIMLLNMVRTSRLQLIGMALVGV